MDRSLQDELHEWRKANFPDGDANQQLMGIVEEVGELNHAFLKRIQGIRGMDIPAKFEHAAQDAVGDLMIYLSGLCSYMGWDLNAIIDVTAKDVMARDWVQYPKDGINE